MLHVLLEDYVRPIRWLIKTYTEKLPLFLIVLFLDHIFAYPVEPIDFDNAVELYDFITFSEYFDHPSYFVVFDTVTIL